jgi:hypothetical protein
MSGRGGLLFFLQLGYLEPGGPGNILMAPRFSQLSRSGQPD